MISFAISWSLIKNKKNLNEILIPLLIGPYLLTSFLLQSGLFTDRSRDLRQAMEYATSMDMVKNQSIKVNKSSMTTAKSQSQIIKISLLTPKLGEVFENISNLNTSELAWSADSKETKNKNQTYEIIYDDPNLYPWKLIKKK